MQNYSLKSGGVETLVNIKVKHMQKILLIQIIRNKPNCKYHYCT